MILYNYQYINFRKNIKNKFKIQNVLLYNICRSFVNYNISFVNSNCGFEVSRHDCRIIFYYRAYKVRKKACDYIIFMQNILKFSTPKVANKCK